MLPQTKRAIDTLKAAGLNRHQFSVTVTRHYYTDEETGKRYYEYGTISIRLKERLNPELVDIQMIVDNGYDVTQYVGFVDDRRRVTFDIKQGGRRGEFKVLDYQASLDEYGYNFAKTYYLGREQWVKRF